MSTMYAYEPQAFEPQVTHRRFSQQQHPPSSFPTEGSFQPVVLLTPRQQPTMVWPMPTDESTFFHHHPQRGGYVAPAPAFFAPQRSAESPQQQHDPLAHHRRFPSPTNSLSPTETEFVQQAAPILIPYGEYFPIIPPQQQQQRPRKQRVWQPRPLRTFHTPRGSFGANNNNNYVLEQQHPQKPTTLCSQPLEIDIPSPSSTPSQSPLPCQDAPTSNKNTTPASTAPLPTRALSPPPLPPAPPPAAPAKILPPLTISASLSSSSTCSSQPPASSPLSSPTPNVPKRRKKQLQAKQTTVAVANPVNKCDSKLSSWKKLPWKICRWLLSHEKSVVRLLLCVLLLGSLFLSLESSKGDKGPLEAENWSKPKYDWINNL